MIKWTNNRNIGDEKLGGLEHDELCSLEVSIVERSGRSHVHANLHLHGSGLLHVLPEEVVRELELHEALGQELGDDAVHVRHDCATSEGQHGEG